MVHILDSLASGSLEQIVYTTNEHQAPCASVCHRVEQAIVVSTGLLRLRRCRGHLDKRLASVKVAVQLHYLSLGLLASGQAAIFGPYVAGAEYASGHGYHVRHKGYRVLHTGVHFL